MRRPHAASGLLTSDRDISLKCPQFPAYLRSLLPTYGFSPADALNRECQGNILIGGQCIQKVEILENKTQLLSSELIKVISPESCHIYIIDDDLSAGHTVNRRDTVEQRCLTASRRSHDPTIHPPPRKS